MRKFAYLLFGATLLAAVAAISAQVELSAPAQDEQPAVEVSTRTAALSPATAPSETAVPSAPAAPSTSTAPSVSAPAFRSEPADAGTQASASPAPAVPSVSVPAFRSELPDATTEASPTASATPSAQASRGEPATPTASIDVSAPAVLSEPPAAPGEQAALSAPHAAEPARESNPAAPAQTPGVAAKIKKTALVAARVLFAAAKTAAPMQARSIGFYAKGCLAGAQPLPVDGPAWQAMRLSRNRNWGHPGTIAWIEQFAKDTKKLDGWPGLLVGDISQPRGGPMLTGHASHQVGLDADLWLTPMPDRRLTDQEREDISATSMLGPDSLSVDPQRWTPAHAKLIKRAASYKEVERIFVHPAIKRALCEGAASLGPDRSWLHKVRPYWGHYYHFHVRLACPKNSVGCEAQPATSSDDGCGKEVTEWLARIAASLKPAKQQPYPNATKAKPRAPLTLAQLPGECRAVLAGGTPQPAAAAAAQRKADHIVPASTAH